MEIVKVTSGLLSILERQKNGIINNSSPLYRIVKPIPITEEILKKNGFFGQEYGEIIIGEWRIMCDCFNVAILHNTKNNRFELAPNFDMEMCFKPSRAKGYDHEFAMVNIDYCARNYADILDDFIDRMKAVNDRKKINKLFKSEIKDPKMLDKFVNYTLDNASKFLKNYNEYILDIDDVNLPN